MKSLTRTDCRPCDNGVLDRPRYFARQIITADDMTLEQQYFRDKSRRHNRFLHGWGVVCGALVCPVFDREGKPVPWQVSVRPGYVLGPYGDEILIGTERIVNLRTGGVVSRSCDMAGEVHDPWCTPVPAERNPEEPLYIAVKYKEFSTRPVRVQPIGCGCNDSECEPSRICDGYELGVLCTACPETHKGSEHNPSLNYLMEHEQLTFLPSLVPECPPCPDSPWVYLAEVRVDGNGSVTRIDNCTCRRMVLSFARTWWECTQPTVYCEQVKILGPNNVPVTDRRLQAGNTYHVEVAGKGFGDHPEPKLGPGITVLGETINVAGGGTVLTFDIRVNEGAAEGPRDMTVVSGGCHALRCEGLVTVYQLPPIAQ